MNEMLNQVSSKRDIGGVENIPVFALIAIGIVVSVVVAVVKML